MAHTQKTENYEFPIFESTDVPSWLTDFNGAMQKIDSAIKGVADVSGAIVSRVASVETAIGTLESDYQELTSLIAANTGSIETINELINKINGDIVLIDESIKSIQSSVGLNAGEIVKTNTNVNTVTALANTNKSDIEKINVTNIFEILSTGWSDTAPYEQTILFSTMREQTYPIYAPFINTELDVETQSLMKEEFSKIDHLVTFNGSIKLICNTEKPANNFSIIVKGV